MAEDNSASTPPAKPIEPIDTSKIIEDVEAKVSETYDKKLEEIELGVEKRTEEKVFKMKEELISNISGDKKPKYEWEKKGKKEPESWDQLMKESDKRAEKKFDEKIKTWEKDNKDKVEASDIERAKVAQERKNRFSKDWYDLVQSNKMPSPSEEIMEKLKSGVKISEQEVSKDRGLIEYRKLVKATLENNSDNLKVTFYEDYSQNPAGLDAPVFGSDNSGSSMGHEEELSYEDIHNS